MAGGGPSSHIVPMNSVVEAAPKEALVFATIHCKIDPSVTSAERIGNGLRRIIMRGRIQMGKAHSPGSAIVGGHSHLEGNLGKVTAPAAKKADGVSFAPQQSGLIVETSEIAEQFRRVPFLSAVAEPRLNEAGVGVALTGAGRILGAEENGERI